jgi:hypothetical protein
MKSCGRKIRMGRIAVDIDGVLASKLENGVYPQDYVIKTPLDYAREGLMLLKEQGHYVYLFTARYEEDREVTIEWLGEHGFDGLYEELVMGKPKYDVLIDDRAIRHDNWIRTMAEVSELHHKGKWF